MRLFRKPHPVAMFLTWLIVVFNVLFPKGGIKAGPLPITWGYLFIALSAPVLLLYRVLVFPLRYRAPVYLALLLAAPMQVLFVYAGLAFGVRDAAFAFANFVGLFVMPFLFLLLYPPFLAVIDGDRLSRYVRWCMLLAAIWGILMFFWHPITGHYIEIPYLTVNAADYGQLELTKHIARGLFFKLISTYNNGNLYGVATLILLPLYDLLEPVKWRRITLKIALVLTLSRTVWIGLVLNESLPLIVLLARQARTFPVLYLGKAARKVLAVGVMIGIILSALVFNNANLSFLFDTSGGGRLPMLELIFKSGWLPSQPLGPFSETVYTSAAYLFGFVGMFAFALIMFSPLVLLMVDNSALRSPTRRAALKGLLLYAAMAAIDGGINYLPMMLFYWFTYMTFIYGWPGEARGEFAAPGREAGYAGYELAASRGGTLLSDGHARF